jgi:hypothetical protein
MTPRSRTERRAAHARIVVLAIAVAWLMTGAGLAQEPTPEPTVEGCSPRSCDLQIGPGAEPVLTEQEVVIEVLVTNVSGVDRGGTALTATPPAPAPPQRSKTRSFEAEQSQPISFTFERDATWEERLTFVVTLSPDENAGNNTVSIVVDFGGGEEGAPDLALAAGDPPGRPRGESIGVRVRVTNQGPQPASAQISVTPRWEAEPERASAEDIPPGEGRTVEVRFAVPAAARGAPATFDATATALEGEEETADNEAEVTVDIPAAVPDLAAGRPRVEQDESGSAEVVTTIRNLGAGRSQATSARARAAGLRSAPADVPALDAGASTEVRNRVRIPSRRRGRRVRFTVTVAPLATETVRDNNTARAVVRTLEAGGAAGDDDGSSLPIVPIIAAVIVAGLAAALLVPRWLGHGPAPPTDGPSDLPPTPFGGERRVVTGFASPDDPGRLLEHDEPLVAGRPCHFCVEIGPPVAPETATDPAALLDVVVFTLAGELGLSRDANRGVLELAPQGGEGRVVRQPADVAAPADVARRRLLFSLRPQAPGGELRCSLYCRGVLLWSQRVDVPAVPEGAAGEERSATVDFGIAPTLTPRHLARLPKHRLSLLLNSTAEGTHVLTIAGEGAFSAALVLDPMQLQQMLDSLRGALRMAAWGSNGEWSEDRAYLYESSEPERLRLDVARLAVRSRRFYQELSERLVAAGWDWRDLRERMRAQGMVQLAIKESPTHLLPTALIYDRPLDDTHQDFAAYELCPAFLAACRDDPPLEDTACFRGECPHWGEETVVCPSGFWGFRHDLGATVSSRGRGQADIVGEIAVAARPELVMAVSTDSRFEGREAHELAIRELCDGGWHHATTRQDALAMLSEGRAHVVYFYCHGGVQNDNPTLQVGAGPDSLLTPSWLGEHGPTWSDPRPLVVLNGCRTTAVEPRNALNFVSVWLSMLRAAGVVGTDITVFEPLASAFAERCLTLFLQGVPLGRAVRLARLGLLKEGNPLGLTYVPFALASLRLVEQA